MDDAGKELSFSWPNALPAPAVTGTTALYGDVLPDVDLSVEANAQGGFTDTIIVKTAQAAQNPALRTLNLATSTAGVTLSADSDGNMSATDSDGTLIFHAPTPMMWDSGTSGSAPQSLRAGARAAVDGTATADHAADGGPAPGAQVAPVAVHVTDDHLQLTPSADLLHNSGTTFPVYIDPSPSPTWIYGSVKSGDYTYIQSGHPGASNWDSNDTYDSHGLGVGYQGYESPIGVERSIYQFKIGTSLDAKVINSAALSLDETYVASLGCETHAVQAYSTAPHIGSGTTWNNYSDATAALLDTEHIGGAYNTGCAGADPAAFDVTSAVSSDGDGIVTLELRGDEGSTAAFKRFAKTAKLSYEYDTVPSVPTNIGTIPAPQDAPGSPNYGCFSDTWGWISAGGSGGYVTLSGKIADPDGQSVYGQFELWDGDTHLIVMGAAADPNAGTLDSNADTNWQDSGSTALKRVPTSKLVNGDSYGFRLRANDGIRPSDVSTACHFRYDSAAPSGITVNNSGATNGSCINGGTVATVGTPEHFSFAAVDNGSGLDHFDWTLGAASDLADDGGSHLAPGQSLTITPGGWGTYILDVAALDKAGNESGTVCYTFYVPDDPVRAVTPGDIDGDQYRDIAAVPAAGSYPGNPGLRYYPTNVIGSQGAIASNQTDGPDTDGGWTGALVAHRSTLQRSQSGTRTDDLWALGTNDALYLYSDTFNRPEGPGGHNNQLYTSDIRASAARPACDTAVTTCTQYKANWSDVRQLIAPGDMNGDGIPDLVTEETGSLLWFFPGSAASGQLGAPQLIGSGGWDGYTVIAPGNTTGDSGVAKLWARNNANGNIYGYATAIDAARKLTLPAPAQIGTGYPASAYPLIISVGDISGDGAADLIAVTTAGQLVDQLGSSTTGFNGTPGNPAEIAHSGWTQIAAIN